MAVKVKFHRGAYWLFIDYKGKRQAKRVGTSEKDANDAAAKIQAKLLLGQFNIEDEEDKREREWQERERIAQEQERIQRERERFRFSAYSKEWLETYVKAHCKERTHTFSMRTPSSSIFSPPSAIRTLPTLLGRL